MEDLSDRIAARAYERFVARGGEHGHDVEDWLAAEVELTWRPCDVVLVDGGPNTIELVRTLRDMTGLALAEIRALIEAVPRRIQRVDSIADGERFLSALEALGARVELHVLER